MIALIVVALGAVVAAVGTGVLTAHATQTPRIYYLAWAVALFGLAIGLGAATLGYLAGFGDVLFRTMEFGAQLLAPLSLCLAITETSARGLPGRFAMRLAVSGLGVIALVVMGTDPLNPNASFSTTWADPTLFYQLAPLTVLGVLALFTAVTAVAAIVLTLVRSSREQLARAEVRPVVLVCVAALALALPGLSWLTQKGLGFTFPIGAQDVFAAGCTLAAALIFYAARVAGQRYLGHADLASGRRHERDDDDWDDEGEDDAYGRPSRSYRGYETGDFDRYGPDDRAYDESAYHGRRRGPDDRLFPEPESELHYPGLAALAAEHAGSPAGQGQRRGELDQFGDSGAFDSAAYDSAAFDSAAYDSVAFDPPAFDDSAAFDSVASDSGAFDGRYPPQFGDDSLQFDRSGQFSQYPPAGRFGEEPAAAGWDGNYPAGRSPEPPGPMFGQITIYTLFEGSTDEFDQLTEWVVAQVRAREPNTLVYIAHAVPSAPMQRILYEVYRDRIAHDEHLSQGYVRTYEAEQRPFVLATNVIELDLQQAKVTPLPTFSAISDLLSESGIDLTGITRSSPAPYGFQRSLPAGESFGEHQYPEPGYGQPGYGQPDYGQPGYEPPYQGGWAEIRGDDSRYQ
jgi:quinol monooxygenase YgiN